MAIIKTTRKWENPGNQWGDAGTQILCDYELAFNCFDFTYNIILYVNRFRKVKSAECSKTVASSRQKRKHLHCFDHWNWWTISSVVLADIYSLKFNMKSIPNGFKLEKQRGNKIQMDTTECWHRRKSRCRVKDNHNNHVPETIPEISVKGRSVIFFKVSKWTTLHS